MAAQLFDIRYSQEAVDDLKPLRPFDQKRILEGIGTHLAHEPTKVSRSRIKLMAQPFWCHYRLRVEGYRVYYDVGGEKVVNILRILHKGQGETPKEPKYDPN
jgi:mRNA interferase RelE/StbE